MENKKPNVWGWVALRGDKFVGACLKAPGRKFAIGKWLDDMAKRSGVKVVACPSPAHYRLLVGGCEAASQRYRSGVQEWQWQQEWRTT